ncbi:hypothetical protein KY284_013020 [Solanum tuberosum]|nr:hypothetical protein KY284_013020 [Solanum tuberosum]
MHKFRRTEIFKHLGFLTDIMRFSPDRDLIEALIPFWDSTSNMFRFSDFELTPTLEELGGFTGLGKDLRSKTLIAPRNVNGNKFLEQMHIIHPYKECFDNGLVSLEFLYSIYGKKEGFSDYGKQLKNAQHLPTWAKHRQEAFMVAFLGTMVFPRRDKKISNRLSGIVAVMMKKKKYTILPMMLVDIYRALTKYREWEDFFKGCSILLQMWFLEHLHHHRFVTYFKSEWTNYILCHPDRMKELVDKLPKGVKAWRHYLLKLAASDITWNYHWFPASEGDDTQSFVWEVLSEDRDQESEAQKIWVDQRENLEIEKRKLKSESSKLGSRWKDIIDIAKRFTSYQAEVTIERNQWMGEREELHNQIEELQAHEEDLTHTVGTTQEWLQNYHENMEEAKGQVLQLIESLIDVYGGYLHRSDESLGRHARALAPHLPKALFKVYSSLGGN